MTRRRSRRCLFAAVTLLAASLLATAASGASQASHTLRVYAVPNTVQFMNHADDRLRGMATNPFKFKSESVILNDNGKEKGLGPFPGDDLLYTFKLFHDAKLAKPAGTALFTCYYEFAKRATCDSYFDLPKGLVLASGIVKFGQTRFVMGITGGTRAYLGALGQVNSTAVAKDAERFDLHVTGTAK